MGTAVIFYFLPLKLPVILDLWPSSVHQVNVTFIETLLKGRRWFLDPGAWGVFRMHRHQVPK